MSWLFPRAHLSLFSSLLSSLVSLSPRAKKKIEQGKKKKMVEYVHRPFRYIRIGLKRGILRNISICMYDCYRLHLFSSTRSTHIYDRLYVRSGTWYVCIWKKARIFFLYFLPGYESDFLDPEARRRGKKSWGDELGSSWRQSTSQSNVFFSSDRMMMWIQVKGLSVH